MLRFAAMMLLLASFLLPPATAQGTQEACPDAPEPQLFFENESSLENLAFDGNGSLYLSDAGGARILRVSPDGTLAGTINLDAHGIVWGPDNRLYAAVTAGAANDIQRSTDASATAFEVYSKGLPVFNGMAFDGAGNLYVSDDNIAPPEQPPDLVRIPAADPAHWQVWSDLYGPDGLVYDPASDALYTVVPADQASPVLRLSTTDSAKVEVVAYLSYGLVNLAPGYHDPEGDTSYPVPKGLDDLTLGPDGLLYLAAHLSGELLRLDPASGSVCVLASGLEEPSSVRIAHGFGPHGGKLFVTTFGGTGVTALALGQADIPSASKVWMFDVGFDESGALPPSGGGSFTSSALPFEEVGPSAEPDEDGPAKESPGLGLAFVAALLAVAVLRRR